MVDQLADEYADANKPVIFIEQDVDNPVDSSRSARWWAANGYGGSVTLPLVMVDSGHQFSNGYEDFYTKYKSMVDRALTRPPQASISGVVRRVDDAVQFAVQVTNLSTVTLSSGYGGNNATVYAVVYEDNATDGLTNRYVRAVESTSIASLSVGATDNFTLTTASLIGVDWDNLHFAALVDYRPGDSGAYDMLQSALEASPPQSDFVISNIAGAEQVAGGDTLTYTIRVQNTGETALHATIIDVLPTQVSYSGTTIWSAAISQSHIWSTTFAVTVNLDVSGVLVNRVTVSTTEGISKTVYAITNPQKVYLPLIVHY